MSFREMFGGFFRGVGRAFAFMRLALANLVVAIVVVLLLMLLFAGPGVDAVPDTAALTVRLKGTLVEETTHVDPLSKLLGGSGVAETLIVDVLEAIEEAQTDDRIRILVLDVGELTSASAAQMQAIGEVLAAFKETGKKVVVGSNYFSQGQYYLASYADELYMHPMGQVMLTGYGTYQNYYRGLLDKLKVNVHVFRVGTYKAAVEPYTRSDMSPAAKEANKTLIDDLWSHYAEQIVANRGMTREALERYVNEFDELLESVGGDTARAALEHGLVDELINAEELNARLVAVVGADDDGRYQRTGLANYLAAVRGPELPSASSKVGVIVARGVILMGDRPRGSIGAQSMSDLVRKAREDKSVKAVVVRVDSPGGSAFASEVIRQQLELTQLAGKPVVVSMGGVAASGGYWIAATADEIWAAPTTITGSIGVFVVVPTFEDSLAEIGVRRDGVGTGTMSGSLDLFGGINARMSSVLQARTDNTYRQFLDLVARGRDMTPDAVDAVAQGRVWAGDTAMELGLVDHLGHLDDAIAAAAKRADLDDYEVTFIRKPFSAREKLLQQLSDSLGLAAATDVTPSRLVTELLSGLDWLAALNDPRDTYALCESCTWR